MPRAAPAGKLRLAVYIGWHRWCGWRNAASASPDAAEAVLAAAAESGHEVCALIVRAGDRLEPWSRRLRAPLLTLPAALCGAASDLRRRLTDAAWRRNPRLRRWLEALEGARPDLGLVYGGGWLPPRVFNLPPLGFVNFHPGPLPWLPGYLPELFLALWGAELARGTLHQVADAFDSGRILAYTGPLALPRLAAPGEIESLMIRAAAAALPGWLDGLASGKLPPVRPERREIFRATLAEANRASLIDWSRDVNAVIERKLRCFGPPFQGFRHPLHAILANGPRLVLDVEPHAGAFPGRPGGELGVYRGGGWFRGAPAIRTLDGLALVKPGAPFRPGRRPRRPGGRPPGTEEGRPTRLSEVEWRNGMGDGA